MVVNLYPFAETVRAAETTLDQALEQIDIGGVALLRAAAKNFPGVAAVSDPTQYASVLRDLKAQGTVSPETRQKLAAEAFALTAAYDAQIASYLNQQAGTLFPSRLTLVVEKKADLRYGENPHQLGAFYADPAQCRTSHQPRAADRRQGPLLQQPARPRRGLGDRQRLQDARPSRSSSTAIPAAWRASSTWPRRSAWPSRATRVSAYGGIIGANRVVDEATARAIRPGFFEAIVAPGYTPEALEILRTKKGFEIIEVPPDDHDEPEMGIGNFDFKRIGGGLLVQTFDNLEEDRNKLQVVTQRRPTLEELTDLLFAWRAVRHVKSQRDRAGQEARAWSGMGAGQPSRVVSVEVALRKAGERAPLSVMASRRLLPLPRWHPDRGAGRGDGHHPARRQHPRRDGDRGGGSPSHGDGLHRPPPLPALRHGADGPMDKLIAGEAVAATEAGAIAAARLMGRGDRDGADRAAVEAMRRAMEESEISGTIVIGEGERDQAPMLYIGEKVGNPRRGHRGGYRGRPAGGHQPGRHRLAQRHRRAGRGRARRPDARARHLPAEADRGTAGRRATSTSTTRSRPPSGPSPSGWAARSWDITVVILDRPRHEQLIAEVRAAGARIKLICDGDLTAGISVRRLRHRRARGDGHRRRAGGRAHRGRPEVPGRRDPGASSRGAPTRRRSAPGAWASTSTTRTASTSPNDLASGENVVFCATGVTDGELLRGVRFFGGGARTHSLLMSYKRGIVRFLDTVHTLDPTTRPRSASRRSSRPVSPM